MNKESIPHTITITHSTFEKLRNQGRFGESYSELISRVLDQLTEVKREIRKDNE